MHSEKILVNGKMPTLEEIVMTKLADIFDSVTEMSQKFKAGFKRNENQRALRELLENVALPTSRSLHVLVYGNPGSGKTWAVLGEALDVLCSYPNTNALVVRQTMSEITVGPYTDCVKILSQNNIEHKEHKDPSNTRIVLANGSTVYFKSDKALVGSKDAVSHKIGGSSYAIVILEEVDSISQELAESMPGRMRAEGDFRSVIYYVCNPPDEDHWVHERFWGTDDNPKNPYDPHSRYRVLQANVDKNELVREGFREDLAEDMAGTNLQGRMGDGEFSPQVKGFPIFKKDFSEDLHVSELDLIKNWNPKFPIVRGWDMGWHGNSCTLLQDDWDRRQIRVMKVFFQKHVLFEKWVEDVRDQCYMMFPDCCEYQDFSDVAGNQVDHQTGLTDNQVFKSLGIITNSTRADISPGLQLISTLLRRNSGGKGYMVFDKVGCKHLIQALKAGYCHEKEKFGDGYQIVKKGIYHHIMDSFRYALMHIRTLKDPFPQRTQLSYKAIGSASVPTKNIPRYVKRSYM